MTNHSTITPELSIYDFLYLDAQIVSPDMAEMLALSVSKIQNGITQSIQVFVAGLLAYHKKKGTQAVIGILQRGSVRELCQFDNISSSMQVVSDKGNALGYLLFGTVKFMSTSKKIGSDIGCNHEQAKRLLACITNLCLRQLAIMFTQLQSSYDELDDWLTEQFPLLSKTSRNIPAFSTHWLEEFELVGTSGNDGFEEDSYLTEPESFHDEHNLPVYYQSADESDNKNYNQQYDNSYEQSDFVIEYGTANTFWKNPVILVFLAVFSGILGLGTVKAIQSGEDSIQAEVKINSNVLSELSSGETIAKIGKDNMLSSKDGLTSKLAVDNSNSSFSSTINKHNLTTKNTVDIKKQLQDIAIIRIKDDKIDTSDNNSNEDNVTDKQIEQALAQQSDKETKSQQSQLQGKQPSNSKKEPSKNISNQTQDVLKKTTANKLPAKQADSKKTGQKKRTNKAQQTVEKTTNKTKEKVASTTRKKTKAIAKASIKKTTIKKAAIKAKSISKVQTKKKIIKTPKKTQKKVTAPPSSKAKTSRVTRKKSTTMVKPAIKAKSKKKTTTTTKKPKKSQTKVKASPTNKAKIPKKISTKPNTAKSSKKPIQSKGETTSKSKTKTTTKSKTTTNKLAKVITTNKVTTSKSKPAVQKKTPVKKKSTEINLTKKQIQKLVGEIENPQ